MSEEKQKNNHSLRGFTDLSILLGNLKKALGFAFKFSPSNIITLSFLAIATALVPYFQNGLFGKLIDSTIQYQNNQLALNDILTTVILLIAMTAIPNLISLLRNLVYTTFRFGLTQKLELHFWEKISTLDIATIERTEYQELYQKANERGFMSIYNFIGYTIDNLSNITGVVASFVILNFIDKTLLVYAFLGAVPVLYIQIKYGKNIFSFWDLNSNNRRVYLNRIYHFRNLIELTEIKLYQLSKKFLSEIKKHISLFNEELKDIEKGKFGLEIFSLGIFSVFLGMGVWRIVNLTLSGVMPIGQMLFAYTTFKGFTGELSEFFRKFGWIIEFSNYSGYWFKIDEMKPRIENNLSLKTVDFSGKPPRIEFKNVSFRYDNQVENYAIKNLSFTIETGEKIAIVGLSGAGKTTLIKLLCRVYDPETGYILIDGKDLRDINLESWQEQLGVLFQDYADYKFTVKEAIQMGNLKKEYDENKIIKAAKEAQANRFIENLPKKYNQLLWRGFEDGADLSKGEKQRMALARVLYRESPITILDEPTASVDALAEQEIFETLENLPKDRTVVLISHRFSTVKNADKILVIEHGKLIEQGTHQELVSENKKYAELYRVQAESYN
ncbi:MAG: ABC transporter ATP-binding protein [bacterium]